MAGESENQRIARLTPLAEVFARFDTLVKPVGLRNVALHAARGRTVATDVLAAVSRPARPTALIDGYAVRAEEIVDAGPYAPAPLSVPPVRVELGAALPSDCDAVVALEALVERAGHFQAVVPAIAGEGMLAAGADVQAGDCLARAGSQLTDLALATLVLDGRTDVPVREPRVRLVTVRSDAVLDAAAAVVAQALVAGGCAVDRCVGDLAAALLTPASDAVIGIGGTGSGRNDQSVQTLASLGRVEVHGIALSPGETAAFGMAGLCPAILLPGRIDAAIAAWLMLGSPLIDRLCGREPPHSLVAARLVRKIASPLGLVEVVPVRVKAGDAEPIASGYWPLGRLSHVDGWIRVPADSEGYPAGTEVMVRPWP